MNVSFHSVTFGERANFYAATFNGYASFSHVTFCGRASFLFATFAKDTSFHAATFSGDTFFGRATFYGVVDFSYCFRSYTTFSENVDFERASFRKGVNFNQAVFRKSVSFDYAIFSGEASSAFENFNVKIFGYMLRDGGTSFAEVTFGEAVSFRNVTMIYPANFEDVRFKENTLFRGICNVIPGVAMPVTEFFNFNTEVVMDGSSNPWLKRYIDDEQWVRSWRYRPKWRWLRESLFVAWELSSHCGRSFGLWLFWAGVIVLAFAYIYRSFGIDRISLDIDDLKNKRFLPKLWLPIKYYNSFTDVDESKENQMGIHVYIYYSVVTLFGFGNVSPRSNWARFFVGTEVVVGYIMLGGLISIFANVFARRS